MTTRTAGQVQAQRRGEVRAVIGMTIATLILLGGVWLWQARASGNPAAVRPAERAATSAAVSDQEMYQRWQQRPAHDSGAVATTGVSDQEMYSRVRARTTDEEADRAAASDQEMYQRLRLASPASDVP
jgi:hypothetical protein